MNKLLRVLVIFSLILTSSLIAKAQDCTINAGADRTICPGSPFVLTGAATGNFLSSAEWTQIAGPAVTISSTTVAGGAATATVTGYVNDVQYTFRLSAKCTDGRPVTDDAVYKSSVLTVASLGPDRVECPGTITLVGNTLKAGETGVWSVVSGNLPVPSPATSASANVTLPTTGNSVGVTVFRYTITDGTCTSFDEISVRNLGGVSPVTAVSPYNVSCYTVTAARQLSASYGGNGSGQQGTWSFLSGPSTPVFDNIHANNATVSNLIQGTYKLRWTVVGQCVNGTADVTINVSSASQDVTNAGSPTFTYCDGRSSTILNGTKPQYTNETVLWTAASGNPGGATIASPTSPTTAISGLNGSGNYDFIYTITNTVTGCSSTGTYRIRYTAPPSVNITPSGTQILPCGTTQFAIPYTVGGGNLTQWALVSGPASSTIAQSRPLNSYTTASSNSQLVVGMDAIGTYVIRFRRSSDNSSGGCIDAFDDITIVSSRTAYQAIAGTPQFLACGTTSATLAGNSPQAGDVGIGQWTQVSGPNTAVIADRSLNTSAISGLTSGVYVFRWIVSGGEGACGSTQDDVKVIVASQPTVVEAGTSIDACFGTPVTLNGNVPLLNEVGTWTVTSGPAGAVFSNINDPNAVVTNLQANSSYSFRWTISNTCGFITDDVTVTTNNSAGPKQALANIDQCLPSGTTSFTLAGNAPAAGETGVWSLLAGAPNNPTFTNAANTSVSGAVNGTYTFEWRLERNGCSPTRDTVRVTISGPTTVASITGAPSQSVCSLAALALTANQPTAGETGTWTQIEGPGGATINNPNSYNTATVTGLTVARYKFRWTISNNACSSTSADITYNIGEPPTPANAGIAQVICNTSPTSTTSATMAANVITTGTGSWSVVSGPSTPSFTSVNSPTSTVTGLELGTYVLRWTSTNGAYCAPSTSDVTITVGQVANAGADQNLCNTTTTVLTGNDGSTGTWIQTVGPAAATITQSSSNAAIVSDLIPGSYTFQYTITAGGCNTFTDLVNVVVSGPPSTAVAGADQNLCTANGSSVNLLAVAPTTGTGAWSVLSQPVGSTPNIVTPANEATVVNNLLVPGVYLLEWTVTNANCSGVQSNKDIVRITVYAPPTTVAPIAAQNAACQNGVTLIGTTPLVGVGTWTYQSGGTNPGNIVITAPNSPQTTVTGLDIAPGDPYIFRWTISNGTCTDSFQDVSITVVDESPGAANAGPTASVCTSAIGGTGSTLLNATAAVGGTGTWTVVSGPGVGTPATSDDAVFSSPNAAGATVSNLLAGTYVFKWTISNASVCTTESTVTINVFDPPSTANAGPATASYCLYAPVTLAATAPTSGIGTWITWAKPGGSIEPVFSSVNAPNAQVSGLVGGQYTFRWTTSNGPCTTSQDDITVTIEDCQIAVAKAVGTPLQQANGTYNVTFTFKVKNTGTTALSNVQVQDNLALTFPSPKTFTMVSIEGTGTLSANTAFTGGSNQNLLNAASSTLAVGGEETITLVVNVKLY